MRPTFSGFDLIKRALQTYQRAQDVVGHNVANAQTPGYSRQEAVITTTEPFTNAALNRPVNPGQIGTGVQLARVIRVHDQFLTDRVRNESKNLSQWEVQQNALKEIEAIYGELSDTDGLGAQLDQFWSSWEQFSLSPQDAAVRSQVVQTGQKLSESLNYYYSRLVRLQDDVNNTLKFSVNDINSKAQQIADLNMKISAIEATGDDANDLRDQRDLLIDELSKIVNVSTEEWQYGQTAVYISSKLLVQDGTVHELVVQPSVQNSSKDEVVWRDDKSLVNILGGSLKGNLTVRDEIIEGYMSDLNQIATTLAVQVNTLQSSGFGLADSSGIPTTGYNFFEAQKLKISSTNNPHPSYSSYIQGITKLPETAIIGGVAAPTTDLVTLDALGVTAGTFSFTVDGQRRTVTVTAADVTAGTAITLRALLDTVSKSGSFSGAIGTTTINYTTSAYYDSVNRRIMMKIDNSEQDHSVSLQIGDLDGLNANDDTSNFLTEGVSGLMTAQITDPPQPGNLTRVARAVTTIVASDAAARLVVASSVASDPSKLAASATIGGVPGDGSNALAVAGLKQTATMNGTTPPTQTLDEFYQAMIDQVGLDTQQAINQVNSYELQVQTLENRKQEVSGVNIDEELIKMVKYQQVYNAAARMMVVMDEMLQSLLGTVGR